MHDQAEGISFRLWHVRSKVQSILWITRVAFSGQNFVYRIATSRDRKRSPKFIAYGEMWIDPKEMVNRGNQGGWMNRVTDRRC